MSDISSTTFVFSASNQHSESLTFQNLRKQRGIRLSMVIRGPHAISDRRSSNCPSTSSMTSLGPSQQVHGPSQVQQQQSVPALSWQLGSSQSPVRKAMHGQNFSVDSATYREMIERRKSFRNRGSLVSSF